MHAFYVSAEDMRSPLLLIVILLHLCFFRPCDGEAQTYQPSVVVWSEPQRVRPFGEATLRCVSIAHSACHIDDCGCHWLNANKADFAPPEIVLEGTQGSSTNVLPLFQADHLPLGVPLQARYRGNYRNRLYAEIVIEVLYPYVQGSYTCACFSETNGTRTEVSNHLELRASFDGVTDERTLRIFLLTHGAFISRHGGIIPCVFERNATNVTLFVGDSEVDASCASYEFGLGFRLNADCVERYLSEAKPFVSTMCAARNAGGELAVSGLISLNDRLLRPIVWRGPPRFVFGGNTVSVFECLNWFTEECLLNGSCGCLWLLDNRPSILSTTAWLYGGRLLTRVYVPEFTSAYYGNYTCVCHIDAINGARVENASSVLFPADSMLPRNDDAEDKSQEYPFELRSLDVNGVNSRTKTNISIFADFESLNNSDSDRSSAAILKSAGIKIILKTGNVLPFGDNSTGFTHLEKDTKRPAVVDYKYVAFIDAIDGGRMRCFETSHDKDAIITLLINGKLVTRSAVTYEFGNNNIGFRLSADFVRRHIPTRAPFATAQCVVNVKHGFAFGPEILLSRNDQLVPPRIILRRSTEACTGNCSVTLECHALLPERCLELGSCGCHWYIASGMERVKIQRESASGNRVVSRMIITRVTTADTGVYTCACHMQQRGKRVSNRDRFEIKPPAARHYTVHRRSTIPSKAEEEYWAEECPTNNLPLQKIDWFINGKRLQLNENGNQSYRYKFSSDRRILYFKCLEEKCTIKCEFTTTFGKNGSNTVHASIPRPGKLLIATSVSPYPNPHTSGTMTLTCDVKIPEGCLDDGSCDCDWKYFDRAIGSGTQDESKEMLTARTTKSKTMVSKINNNYSLLTFWKIDFLKVGDSGLYFCVCSIVYDGAQLVDYSALNVTVIESVAPHFGNASSFTLDVERGKKGELVCPAQGVPEPSIDWYQDDRPLSFNDLSEYQASSDRRSLHVPVANRSLFACIAYNKLGHSPRLNITVNPIDVLPQLPPWLIVVGTFSAIMLFLLGATPVAYFIYIRSKRVNLRNVVGQILAKSAKRSITLDGKTFPYPMLPSHVEDALKIPLSRIKEGAYLSSGTFGAQFRATLDLRGDGTITQEVAIKALKLETASIGMFLKEALIMRHFNHPHVMPLTGIAFLKWVPLIVTPFMENGDLRRYLRDATHVIMTWDVLKFALNIAQGMKYLHSKLVVHRDLACRNCMLDEELEVKIGDFGLCRDVDYAGHYISTRDDLLPVRWMAPESIQESLYSIKTDVWAYGVVLWELTSRCAEEPYSEFEVSEEQPFVRSLLSSVKNGYRLKQPAHCPDFLYKIMLGCFEIDESKRPDFAGISSHLDDVMQCCKQNLVTVEDANSLASDDSGAGNKIISFCNCVIPVLDTFELHDGSYDTAALTVDRKTSVCSGRCYC